MLKKIILVSVILVICGLAINALTINPAQAQNSIVDPGNPNYASGDYTLNDILLVGIGVSRWILGIVGALALAMFIYGGVIFLISGGSSEKIGQARKIIVAAVVGLIIVFASYIIIQFVLKSLGLNWQGTNQKMTPTTSFIINRS